MAEIWQGAKTARNEPALAALRDHARQDLLWVAPTPSDWMAQATGPDGRPMLDVLVVGGGMCGQTLAFALMREGLRKVRIIDRNPRGEEGPWATYARMEILRSPKSLTGPDLGIPSLTFRAWFEAQHGREAWERLHKAGRLDWRDYLLWVRETVGIAIENGTELVSLKPHPIGVEAGLATAHGSETVWVRRVVLAGGRDGAGGGRMPLIDGLAGARATAPDRLRHSCEWLDTRLLPNARVAVLGAGATGFDCAATALEAGAAEVTMFLRRAALPQVNKSKWTSFPGFIRGFHELSDADRWRFYTTIFEAQVPPPYESVLRCTAHANFAIRFSEPWSEVRAEGKTIAIATAKGRHEFDVALLATGFDVDPTLRPELREVVANILVWSDRIDAEAAARDPESGRFPYLGPGFELMERRAGATPGLQRIHMFNWGVTMSHGALAGDIPGLGIGVARLTDALVGGLFREDLDAHRDRLAAFDERELKPTPLYVP